MPVLNKNDSNKSNSCKNDNIRQNFEKNNGNDEINRFYSDGIEQVKKSEKLKNIKSSKS